MGLALSEHTPSALTSARECWVPGSQNKGHRGWDESKLPGGGGVRAHKLLLFHLNVLGGLPGGNPPKYEALGTPRSPSYRAASPQSCPQCPAHNTPCLSAHAVQQPLFSSTALPCPLPTLLLPTSGPLPFPDPPPPTQLLYCPPPHCPPPLPWSSKPPVPSLDTHNSS